MKTILLTNSDNIFGNMLIEKIMGNYNILRLLSKKKILENTNKINSIPYSYYTNTIECLPFSYTKIDKKNVINNITEINKIINYANTTYGGIDVCIDCKETTLNEINLELLIIHHLIIQNNHNNINKCKIIYNNNQVHPFHINQIYPLSAKAYNSNNSVQSVIDIIGGIYKFSTNSDTPYFDSDDNEISSKL